MWTFIKYDVKQRLRDRATLFWMLLFPLILIFGLGTMLSAVFSDTFELPVTNVAYVEASTDQYREPLENFLNDEDIQAFIRLVPYEDIASAEQGVNDGDADVILRLDGSDITLLYEEPTTVEFDVLEAILGQYTAIANQQITLAESGLSAPYENEAWLDTESVDLAGRTPTSLEYFTVTISIMTALFGSFYITAMAREEQPNIGSYLRIQAAPVRTIQYRLARTFSRYVIILLQLILLFWFSHFVYRTFDLANVQFGYLILAWLALTAYGVAIGFVIVNLPKLSTTTKDAVVNGFVAIIMILSGGYVPGFDQVTLNYAPWAAYVFMPIFMRDGMLAVMLRGGDMSVYWESLGLLGVHLLIFIVLSYLLSKGVRRYGTH
ncbi:ABC transporter permease [Exiguobacterium sp. B2(2022)]|uniref:ABC transporter permease n=1 Tax=Exiguobacterium sp. B2(2022) TaxID=2992755 RepID=UPI00237A311D|nr:ABC transporter permease [Exiguobacterium sp. B2(2022)]MDE0563030.1 ABC transporter permease [Exiguobacterium sp. B2(2022)]